MQFQLGEQERKDAKRPHEIFLINLITNHILLFVALLGLARSNPEVMLLTPVISMFFLGYLLWRANHSRGRDHWFAQSHWMICARRSKIFIAMLLLMALLVTLLLFMVNFDAAALKPGHYALGGVAILPTMITVLVLVIMESDAMHQASEGRVAAWAATSVGVPAGITPLS
ncbi:MAG: hypothetical protein HQL49_13550 [Gammaproteobacteria bacterium]|nr:hypothetical protein [Gammaproteobacteria bacterium]